MPVVSSDNPLCLFSIFNIEDDFVDHYITWKALDICIIVDTLFFQYVIHLANAVKYKPQTVCAARLHSMYLYFPNFKRLTFNIKMHVIDI